MSDRQNYQPGDGHFGACPDPDQPSFNGQKPDQGRVFIGEQFPGEGYAVLRCGGTDVQISYTVLHGLQIEVSPYSSQLRDMALLQKAIYSVTCEASLGRTGDETRSER